MAAKFFKLLAFPLISLYFATFSSFLHAEIALAKDDHTQPSSATTQDSDSPEDPETVLSNLGDYTGDDSSDVKLGPLTSDEDNKNLWSRIKKGYGMPDLESPYTSAHESWYSTRPEYVKRMVDRSQKYLHYIVGEVEKRGMPTEIALLPMVESAFNPKAYSTSRASGIWQFVPATGKNFGLKQNWWVDNRRDVVAATNAALTYLQKLHSMFGTWDLALAAYNAGEGTVMRAIEKNRKKGLPTDYQSLNLPPETQNYVPKLQAVKNIMSDPAHYGLNVQSIADQPYFTSVAAPQQIDAKLAAKLAGISAEEFVSLNPEYNRPVLTSSPGSTHEILLPVGSDETFTNNLSNYEKPLVSWQTYYAKRGEKQELIARKFGLSLAQLRDVNDLPSKGKLRNGLPLLVPISGNAPDGLQPIPTEEMAASAAVTQTISEPEPASKIHHTIKKGDSIRSVANKYGVTPKAIMLANHMHQATVKPGQVLVVELPTQTKASINKVSMKKGHAAETRSVSSKIHAKTRNVSSKSKVTRSNTSAKHHAAAKHRA